MGVARAGGVLASSCARAPGLRSGGMTPVDESRQAAAGAGVPDDATRRPVAPLELVAMDRALELASRGPAGGANPRVGCVLLDGAGRTLAEAWHEGAGTPHAEAAAVAAARAAGADLHGATAVVTLEPCRHTGRTPPCVDLLLDAGIARVVYGLDDPNPAAGGGARVLAARGVDVVGGVRGSAAAELLRAWAGSVRAGRPWVTLKLATSLDGRVAAADGSARWITSAEARAHGHRLRAEVGAIAVGTGTVLADDPALTARQADGSPARDQPLRVVVGERDLPVGARLHGPGGEVVHVRTHDPADVLEVLAQRQVRHLLVEGGPTLSAAFLRSGLVDQVVAYVAPALLGAGPAAVGDLGITGIGDALRLHLRSVERVGPDVVVVAEPGPGDGPVGEEH